MLRVLSGLLFGLLVIASVFASVGLADYIVYPGTAGTQPMIWICFAMAAIVFIMGCIGLFVLITTKANITISKQFITEKQQETKKSRKK